MKITLLILLATVSIARANLIDLTPGGFDPDNGIPKAFFHLNDLEVSHYISFFDEATPTGWISLYGILNGGTYFTTNLIGNSGPSANVSWDFSALPGYSMSVLLVEGERWAHLYGVPFKPLRFIDAGETVTLHDNLDIQAIAFFGRTPTSAVPDTGSTLAMMGIGLLGIFVYARRVNASASDVSRSSATS